MLFFKIQNVIYVYPPMSITQYSKLGLSSYIALGSATEVFSKIQKKCVVPTCSSGSDLKRAKHFGVETLRTKFLPDWFKCFWDVAWWLCMLVQVPSLSPAPYELPLKWDIVRIHFVPATQPPNLSPIATISSLFYFHPITPYYTLYIQLIGIYQ